jgi:hypothetical protein
MQLEIIIILAVFGVWLLILSLTLYFVLAFFRRLTKGAKEGDLKKVLEKILNNQSLTEDELERIQKKLSFLEDDGKFHIQKMGLVRFNPFREIGGDHSFSLAILDGKGTGVVITGLHTRERTRIYMKAIKNGKSEYELSDEEKKAVVKAQKS